MSPEKKAGTKNRTSLVAEAASSRKPVKNAWKLKQIIKESPTGKGVFDLRNGNHVARI
ncbi:MAG: hypothetical protein KKE57_10275 [Proteobacteria bacterium]|nr:hypothetical protein [Pseudomonadota bacterium]